MLDIDEKRAFVLLAEKLIEADGIVIGREEAALSSLKAEIGIAGSGDDARGVEELARVFKNRSSRVATLLELFGLAYSDTNFDMGELSLIASVAHFMGLDTQELDALERWVQNHVSLVHRAIVLMRG